MSERSERIMYHLIVFYGWKGREKDVCIESSNNINFLASSYKRAKGMQQNPRIYKTELMPPLPEKLTEMKPIEVDF